MSFLSNINGRFVKKKISFSEKRTVILKKPVEFLKILLVSNEKDDAFSDAAKTGFPNAEINFLFLRNEKEDKSGQFNYSVHSTDFNLTGKLKNDKLSKLLHSEFDMVVDLSENSVYLRYILTQIKSTLVIGKINEGEIQVHDLCLNPSDQKSEFIKTILKQLNHLIPNEK